MQRLGWLFTENQSFQKKILESVGEGKLSSVLIVPNPGLLISQRGFLHQGHLLLQEAIAP